MHPDTFAAQETPANGWQKMTSPSILRNYFENRAEVIRAAILGYSVKIARRIQHQISNRSSAVASLAPESVENLLLTSGAKLKHRPLPIKAARDRTPIEIAFFVEEQCAVCVNPIARRTAETVEFVLFPGRTELEDGARAVSSAVKSRSIEVAFFVEDSPRIGQ